MFVTLHWYYLIYYINTFTEAKDKKPH